MRNELTAKKVINKLKNGGDFVPFIKSAHFDHKGVPINFVLLRGWGNGYVSIPKESKLFGVHYDEITVNVHGGLTFFCAEMELDWEEIPEEAIGGWIVGFDTVHYMDNKNTWSKEHVWQETLNLMRQLMKL